MSNFADRIAALSPEKRALLLRKLNQQPGQASQPSIQRQPRDRNEFPLSFAQQRLWFLDQLTPGIPIYNEPLAVRLSGALDVPVLQRSLNEIVRRHEALRTTFVQTATTIDGAPVEQPMQHIAEELNHPEGTRLPVVDLSELPAAERESEVHQQASTEAQRPFDLSQGPLIRATLLQLGPSEHVLLLTLHHIVSDAWSLGVLVREIAALYDAFSRGQTSPLPELGVQYVDFAEWQREWLSGDVLATQIDYWKQRLGDQPPALELPTSHPRPQTQTYAGARYALKLAPELSQALRTLSAQTNSTLFMTLLAAWQTLLSRYSGQHDITVGTPVANRGRAETEPLIGFFVNTLVMRADLRGNPTFRELLGRVRETALGAYAHGDLPFEKLVEELHPERNLGRSPLFQTMFTLPPLPDQTVKLAGLSFEQLAIDTGTAKFELLLHLWDGTEQLSGWLEYNTALFDEALIARLASHFQVLLAAIVANPDRHLSDLPLLTDAEREQLLVSWNDTALSYDPPHTLHTLIEAQAATTPEATALIFEHQALSYAELNARANQLAHHLRELGVGPETLVGICAERSPELVIGLLGILKAGAAYVPLDPGYPPDRLAFMLHDAQVPVLLTQQALVNHLPEHSATIVCLDADWPAIAGQPERNLDVAVTPDSLAYMIYTSGSTGQPKGAMNSHRAITNRLRWMQDAFQLSANDKILQKTPFSFDVSVWEFFWPLLTGAALVVAQPGRHGDPAYLADLIAQQQITTLHFVPPMLQAFLDEPDAQHCQSLRRVICSGEALPYALQQRFCERLTHAELHNLYGPTEAAVDVTWWNCQEADLGDTVPIGRPIANTQLYVLDAHLQPVPLDVPGELYLGGVQLARGYHARPDLTAEKFIPDPFSKSPGSRLYRTGDLTRWLPNGSIEYLGRLDHQVKLRGFRIELGEIESVLRQHPTVSDAVVLARAERGETRLVAYVVGKEPRTKNLEPNESREGNLLGSGFWVLGSPLREFLAQRLPEYMLPSAFVLLDAWPLTPNGKVDRRALPTPEPTFDSQAAFTAPRNPIEEMIAGIWAEVLHVERVGIHDNFFALGGHSLLATQVISRIRSVFQSELPLHAFFETPTVAGLAERIEQARQKTERGSLPALRPAPRPEQIPLSFAQQRLWFLDQLEPGNPFYNMPTAVHLSGALDLAALEHSLSEVIRRHETLRTTFPPIAGQPVQQIAPPMIETLPLELVDLTALPEAERESRARQLAQEEAAHQFDLIHGPLLRARLLHLSDQAHTLLLTLHHIVSDGWSQGVLVREIAALYRAFVAGAKPALPALPVQYADFAIWQRDWLSGAELEAQLGYWRQQLADLPALQLPTDRPRPAIQSFRGAQHSFTLTAEATAGLLALSRATGVTLFMTTLALFQTLLSRYSGQDDIVVGTPIANRNRAEIEPLIGFFVNTLVMRADLAGNPTFRELLGRVRNVALGAYAYQDLPFEQLVEELQPERDLSRQPLFQVMFALQNAPLEISDLPDLRVTPLPVENNTAKFDLALDLWETPDGLRGVWMYSSDLFDAATIERMSGHFQTLVAASMADVDQPLAALPLLTSAEQEQLRAWNTTGVEYPLDLMVPQLFEAQVSRTPKTTAFVFGQERLSYAELNQRVNQLARHLRELGVAADTLVGICVDRSVEMVVAMLGVLKAGGAYVPFDPEYPQDRLRFMLDDSQVGVVLTQERLISLLPEHNATLVRLDADWPTIAQHGADNLEPVAAPGDLAYLIYTSGTTGKPKAAMVAHRNLANVLHASQSAFGFQPGDVMPWIASFAFDISLFELFNPLLVGGTVICLSRQEILDTRRLVEVLGESSLVHTVPSLMRQIIQFASEQSPTRQFANIRQIFIGGDLVQPGLLKAMRAIFPAAQIDVLYGPTEATIICSHYAVPAVEIPDRHLIGTPLNNMRLRIYDERRRLVPIGVPGEIYVGGAGVTRGYLNRDDLTAEKFVVIDGERWYRTGDLGRYLADGTLEFGGRIDQQVKVRGFRIELGEIETLLNQHAGVRENVVMVREDEGDEKRLVAYVVPQTLSTEIIAPETAGEWNAEQIERWQMVFDETHQQTATIEDATFNIVGWNSSYTGEPIPAEQMRAWVDHTVARIQALQPRRVLEIGCGTGLLLFRIAPDCERYVASDFAAGPLRSIQEQLQRRPLPQVTLLQRPADDFADLAPHSFDTVIINSVVQYFPSSDYLIRVIEGAIQCVAPGGTIVLGDVRSHTLLEAFHTSGQLAQAPATLDLPQL
ncbi:MAG: amino acid adenylation domain-containing protein, partial [Chloroflexi bacterium]|nr:amino acid adenylation domain-containing protein [Chloroflexota bacterium]